MRDAKPLEIASASRHLPRGSLIAALVSWWRSSLQRSGLGWPRSYSSTRLSFGSGMGIDTKGPGSKKALWSLQRRLPSEGMSRFVWVTVAIAIVASACGTNRTVDEPSRSSPSRSQVGSMTESPTAGGSTWERVVPGGDCECADGSEFAFWERRADSTKVLFFLDGGGACFDAETCAFTGSGGGGGYDWMVTKATDDPANEGGIFDLDRADNPFGDYSFLYVPSCTGDAYLGDVTREYSPELTVEHKGYVNGTAALDYLVEHYPHATQVVVVGKTVGSIAAPVYGGLAADRLPDAQVTVFGGQSGHIPDDPDFNAEILGNLWGAYDNMPDWEVNKGLTAREWGPQRFWIQAGLHDPAIVMARFDYAYDPNAAEAADSLGLDPTKLVELLDANEAAIEEGGVVVHSYTAPGAGHGIFEWPEFYELEVNGVRLVDWVTRLITGEPMDDVHCVECEP